MSRVSNALNHDRRAPAHGTHCNRLDARIKTRRVLAHGTRFTVAWITYGEGRRAVPTVSTRGS